MELGTFIAKGNTADIYSSGQHVIKLFHEGLSESYTFYEANKQRSAYLEGLPVPEIIDIKVINGKQAIIMEHIDGTTLGDLYINNSHDAKRYLELSIDVQLAIHKVTINSIEKMSEKLIRQIERASILQDKQKVFLLERLKQMKYESRLCHGDFHLYNLIQNNEGVAIIDWVDASMGDIRADVYRTYLLYMPHSMEFADMYLDLYCSKSGVKKEEILQWAPIIAGARLSENVTGEDHQRLLDIVDQYT
ncbi:aminoglycoside phosphotransferase family protein [Alkalicoccobacillus porphyridii]|uniref:Aminoglycoside phosphotransferase family protein n=1 Tax=Alkalicoccobacillus porphyridii TaxID=2597270 RepID=A0A553ZYU2_9BACI|nr:aminoglycoside phosphotransferase family protein [Alkalicoccobacillus porphyridii]TSB46620.1 aminoglycoside phosphotransferase family protein [Alkalicoccobacillus porphyridii]